jgi:hypothetical protein
MDLRFFLEIGLKNMRLGPEGSYLFRGFLRGTAILEVVDQNTTLCVSESKSDGFPNATRSACYEHDTILHAASSTTGITG